MSTPLGDDVLLLTSFAGEERISGLFRFHLEFLSETDSISATDIVGQSVTWTIQSTDGDPRYFNGVVSRFSAGGMASSSLRRYQAEVVPWLWFLSCTRNCRVFQSQTVTQIIEQIFSDLGFSDYETSQIKGSHPTWDYCVQYRESDLQFVSRLMEQEGVYYYFSHEDGKHTMVLADSTSGYVDCTENEVEYYSGSLIPNHISRWDHQFEFQPGKWTQTDYNFETPSTDLLTTASTTVDLSGLDNYEIFDYPGYYGTTSDGRTLTDIRMEEEEAKYEVVSGASTCKTFTPGGQFTLTRHDYTSEEGIEYVITSIHHTATETSYVTGEAPAQEYRNAFSCIPSSATYRPPRQTPRPIVQGPQTAVVVGPSGEEIYVDSYGRVKVQFFWDREGQNDENSSCWIRVAENWAGKNWGTVFLPRVGQEVIVGFLEGDPDRPIIIGRVYNAEQLPPYTLTDNQTQSGIKTRSSKEGTTDNCNELRFEDNKDSEQIYFHAEKDFVREVENDDSLTVGNDQTITVTNDRSETVSEGNESVTVSKGNRTVTISEGNDTLSISQGNLSITLDQGKISMEAGSTVTLTVGDSSITISSSSITLESSTITLKASTVSIEEG